MYYNFIPPKPPAYEDDDPPPYATETLYRNVIEAYASRDFLQIKMHLARFDQAISLGCIPDFIYVKYCLVTTVLVSMSSWTEAQRFQISAEDSWRKLFHQAADRGDVEAYGALDILREQLNRLEILRVKSGKPWVAKYVKPREWWDDPEELPEGNDDVVLPTYDEVTAKKRRLESVDTGPYKRARVGDMTLSQLEQITFSTEQPSVQ